MTYNEDEGIGGENMNDDKKADQAAAVDMIDGLIDYASKHGVKSDDLAKTLIDATQNGLDGVDALFKDGGLERQSVEDLATGYLVDRYHLEGDELKARHDDMVKAALETLRKHPESFDKWVK
ncbi:hypothetical protein FC75_GL000385 [Lacticaseibacillus camelliae DSM 22697 = JCM 13995]|uniref:Uncharacterized protein n=2 Tax=Lacticaseibacillus camelliae TaxID=381742 RepID=A0A0R2FAS4_9LACO|nr:hypothetical protein FC75_GL000385 [Lacticaseibacillus camelliae DSM 22697 = JCM 13995]